MLLRFCSDAECTAWVFSQSDGKAAYVLVDTAAAHVFAAAMLRVDSCNFSH